MNSKIILVSLILSSACGVKTAPSAPANTALPSIPQSYEFKLDKQYINDSEENNDDLEQKKN
ncbi:MAG: hypothetical protein CME67_06300 [Halobacteriovoraceae bacterium]|nr:hypothetical protein [Peredibacter sp.]MBJ00828.1 hypothetical protein [Halobacteriovoraceae bacterium]